MSKQLVFPSTVGGAAPELGLLMGGEGEAPSFPPSLSLVLGHTAA